MNELVVLFGGGGFLGCYVAQELLRSGARVRIASRNPLDTFNLKPLAALGQAQSVAADITKLASVERAVAGADVVINLVGTLRGKFHDIHVAGAENIARASAAAGAQRLIHISAIGADPNAESPYAKTKGEGEQAVRAAFPKAVILRPSIIFGPEDDFVSQLAGMISKLPVVPVIRAKTRFQPVWVVDVARAVAKSALTNTAEGKTFELGGPQVQSMLELNTLVAELIGRRPTFLAVPDPVAAAMARLGFLPGAPLSWNEWLMLQHDNVVSTGAKTFADLGIEPSPFAAIAPKWLVRYRTHGRFSLNAA